MLFKNFKYPINTTLNTIDKLIDENKGENIEIKFLLKSFAIDVISNVV
jgi:hypothetical protein